MDDAIANARMREFIQAKGLMGEYDAYVKAYDAKRAEMSKPDISVQYDKHYSRGRRDGYMNITPWLKQASQEDMLRFVRLTLEEHDEREDADKQFLSEIIEHCADEEELQWLYRASEVEVWLVNIEAEIKAHLSEIRPDDHETIRSAYVRAKGPMGPEDACNLPEAVGTLI